MMLYKLAKRYITAGAFLVFLSLSVYAENNIGQDRDILLKNHQTILSAFLAGDAELLFSNVGEQSFRFYSSTGTVEWTEKKEGIKKRREEFKSQKFHKCDDVDPPYVKINAEGNLAWILATVRMSGVIKPKGSKQTKPFSSQSSWIEIYQRQQGNWMYIGGVIEGKDTKPDTKADEEN